jgi:hypothetical protein
MSITCPRCKLESHHPEDEKHQYCSNCNQFHYALVAQEPVYLNAIVSHLQEKIRGRLREGSPFSLQFEQFTHDGRLYWRALIKLGNGVWKYSHRPQVTPTDALRELSEIMEAGL